VKISSEEERPLAISHLIGIVTLLSPLPSLRIGGRRGTRPAIRAYAESPEHLGDYPAYKLTVADGFVTRRRDWTHSAGGRGSPPLQRSRP